MISQKEELTIGINKTLVLGSGSVARKNLLVSVGLTPDIIVAPDIDESLKPNESPRNYVMRMANEKANAISVDNKYCLITADTIVNAGNQVLNKTSDELKAYEYLKLLSGRRHNVLTAFCVKHNGFVLSKLVKTSLRMKLLSESEIKAYISSGEWIGCSGAYSIQGRAKAFFPLISGCFSNVIGLPLPKLINVINGLGLLK